MPETNRAGKACRGGLEFLLACEGKLPLSRINVLNLGEEKLGFSSAVDLPIQHRR